MAVGQGDSAGRSGTGGQPGDGDDAQDGAPWAGTRRLQDAMAADGIDAVLLGGDGACLFAGGHRRLRVHTPGQPHPMVALGRSGPAHVVTPDPDGAPHLPPDHLHGIVWDPAILLDVLPRWVPGVSVVGVDTLSPAGLELVRAALPAATLVDASPTVARAMLAKDDEEVRELRASSELANAAAEAGLAGGLPAMVRAMKGAFPVSLVRAGSGYASVALLRDGFAGESRHGPGDQGSIEEALGCLRSGADLDDVARSLPPGIELVGLGRGYEAPVVRDGRASPRGLTLARNAVISVRSRSASVTALVTAGEASLLSPPPSAVVKP